MRVVEERFRPARVDTDSRDAMNAMQTEIADAAHFEDAVDFTVDSIRQGDALVAGVDQAFLDDRVISAVVVLRAETVVARSSAVTPTEMPYVPGLLAFREAPPIIEALESLDVEPDLLLFDGSGRIHYREAGIATHVGVCFDAPSIGVAKNLLCGRPRESTDELTTDEAVPIEADGSMSAPDGTVVGYAYQSRQFPDSKRINPLYVSPGHRLSAETALEQVSACGGAYKLPRPVRLADQYADELKTEL
jgi:deoxyribonuclease V